MSDKKIKREIVTTLQTGAGSSMELTLNVEDGVVGLHIFGSGSGYGAFRLEPGVVDQLIEELVRFRKMGEGGK